MSTNDGSFSRRNSPAGFTTTTSDSGSKSYELSGNIMISVIIVLFFVIVIVVGLHIYARWYLLRARRRQLLRHRNRSNESRRTSQFVFYNDNPTTLIFADPGNQGLDSAVLDSIPVFVYSSKTHPENLDCAVCLSEFEENEKGRVLPKCNHHFHIGCIDMWFHSHSTCPLCRTPVEPVSEPEKNGSGLVGLGRTRNEPAGSSSGFCLTCQQEEGDSSTTSLGSRRKGLDVRIEVPLRNELDNELTLSSPASGRRGYKSPGTRLLSMGMKRIVSIGGRKTPTSESSTSNSAPEEVDLEKGPSELTQK